MTSSGHLELSTGERNRELSSSGNLVPAAKHCKALFSANAAMWRFDSAIMQG
jgi:hypothetical protein